MPIPKFLFFRNFLEIHIHSFIVANNLSMSSIGSTAASATFTSVVASRLLAIRLSSKGLLTFLHVLLESVEHLVAKEGNKPRKNPWKNIINEQYNE